MAGLEPATFRRLCPATLCDALPTELHGKPNIYQKCGSCRCPTLPKILGYSLMDNSEPRSICTFCLISAFLRLIRLSFSPTLPSALHYYLSMCLLHLAQLVSIWIRKLPRFFRLYLRVLIPSFPLRRLVGLFRCRFDQCNVQACALAACTASVISTNAFAYLPGLSLYVPRRS